MLSGLRNFLNRKIIKYIIAIIIITLYVMYLFRGSLYYGLEFDEVFRANNIIPLINHNATPYNQSIFDINILGLKIPLVYKEYISTLSIVKFIPLFLFNDYLFGLRFLEMFYFLLSIIGFFIIASKINFKLAFFLSIAIISSPILYPDVRFGFIRMDHLFLVSLAVYLVYLFFSKSNKRVYLLFAAFLIGLSINLSFYSIWTVAALFIASIIFFPLQWKKVISSFNNILIIMLGFFIGAFNFVIYNLLTGFSSFKPLYLKLFKLEEYNKNPIDYAQIPSFYDELINKLNIIVTYFGTYYYIYFALFAISLIIFLVLFYKLVKTKKFLQHKNYFFVIFTLLIIIIFLLISPKTYRRQHWGFIIPFFEMTIFLGTVFLSKIFNQNKIISKVIFIIPLALLLLNVYSTNKIVEEANLSRGTGYFSPAIYDFNNYINQNKINYNDIIHIQWGMYSQLYFLNKGEVRINSLVFNLKGTRNEQEKKNVIKNYLISTEYKNSQSLYFPIYTSLDQEISKPFFNFVIENKGEIVKVKSFNETHGQEVISLWQIKNLPQFIKTVKQEMLDAPVSSKLRISNLGITKKIINNTINYFIWVETKGTTSNTKVLINNSMLTTTKGKDILTAEIPIDIIKKSKEYEVQLYDLDRNVKSKTVILKNN